jgi:hypothetical protein
MDAILEADGNAVFGTENRELLGHIGTLQRPTGRRQSALCLRYAPAPGYVDPCRRG